MSDGVVVDTHHQPPPLPPPPQNGTFQGVANYPPPQQSQPPNGFPPPGISAPPQHYAHSYQFVESYQTVEGFAVAEGRPAKELDLPCCGIGIGWFLFIIGFFLGVPWYVGCILLICGRKRDNREKPGLIACTVIATLFTIVIVIRAIRGEH